MLAAGRARRHRRARAGGRRLAWTGFADDTIVRGRARSARAPRPGSSRAGRRGSRSGSPSPPGLGGGSSDAAAALRLANELCSRAARRRTSCTRSRRALGADVPFFLARRPAARRPATAPTLEPLDAAAATTGSLLVAAPRRAKDLDGGRLPRLRRARRRARLRGAPRGAPGGARGVRRPPRPRRAARRTTSRPRRSRPSCLRAAPSAPTSAAPALRLRPLRHAAAEAAAGARRPALGGSARRRRTARTGLARYPRALPYEPDGVIDRARREPLGRRLRRPGSGSRSGSPPSRASSCSSAPSPGGSSSLLARRRRRAVRRVGRESRARRRASIDLDRRGLAARRRPRARALALASLALAVVSSSLLASLRCAVLLLDRR